MHTRPAIDFQGVSKKFGEVTANSDVSFQVEAGTIHGIIGENGAGKSTAMNILFGLIIPDAGKIFIHGKEVKFKSSIDAMKEQIGMVHQHFMLAEPLTALDNILLHQKGSPFSILNRKKLKDQLHALSRKYAFEIDLEAKVSDLSVGEQQRLELLKILSLDSNILILDEPTAVLTPQEVQDLFKNLRELKKQGKTILIITHKLKEVLQITDNVTIFRQGKVVGVKATQHCSLEELAELMVGRRLSAPLKRENKVDFNSPILAVKNLNEKDEKSFIRNISLNVHRREIVGIAGVEGNGQDLLIRALLKKRNHNKKTDTGEIFIEGSIASLPEDRLRFGALPNRPIWENFLLGQQHHNNFKFGFFLKIKEILFAIKNEIAKYDIRPANPLLPFENLSGGNQQKLVVARALFQNPQFVVAAQPTRGVDIGAIEFIHNQLRLIRDQGSGVLLISSELDELMTLSDRIHVIYQGQFIAEFSRENFDELEIGAAMGGIQKKMPGDYL